MVQNPFNGIERRRCWISWATGWWTGIHSMELKERTPEQLRQLANDMNPFNGIESKLEVVDFNKTHAKESIQWN